MTCRNGIVQFCVTGSTGTFTHINVDGIDDISGNGVNIEGVIIKDGTINGVPVSDLTDHIHDFNNPHMVTATQVGLGPASSPTFVNVFSQAPTLPNHLATKAYVDSLIGAGGITFYDSENLEIQTTNFTETSFGYITHNTLTGVPTPNGRYRIGWSFDWSNASTSRNLIVKLGLNSTIIDTFYSGFSITGRPEVVFGSENDQKQKMSGFIYKNIVGIPTSNLEINFTRSAAGFGFEPVTVSNSRIEIWKVG